MAKKTKEEVAEAPVAPKKAPITVDELSPMVVALQNEINALQEEKKASRAEFVKQTDSQIAQVKELGEKIASKQSQFDEMTNLIENVYPEERKKFVAVQNKANSELGKLQATIDEIARKESELAKGFEKLAQQKTALDNQAVAQENRSEILNAQEKAIKDKEKAVMQAQSAFKLALGK